MAVIDLETQIFQVIDMPGARLQRPVSLQRHKVPKDDALYSGLWWLYEPNLQ